MAINIVDILKSQIGGQIAGQFGKQFGENEQAVKTGVEAMIPTVLGGLLKQVSSPGGAQKLDKTLGEGGYDGSLLDNLTGMFSGGGAESTTKKGGELVSMLFGDKAAMLGPIFAKLTGMKSGSVMSMLTMVAPIVMSFLGKQKQTMGLDANGLAGLITSQKDSIVAAMPPGVADAMGMGSLGIASPAMSHAAPSAPVPTSGGGGLAKVLIPLALLAAVGYGAYVYIFAGIRPQGAAGNVVVEADPNATLSEEDGSARAPAPSAEPAAAPAAEPEQTPEPEKTSAKSAAETINETLGGLKLPGMEAMPDLKSMLSSLTGSLDKVTDVESAKAALPELTSMDEKLGSLTSGLSAMPEALRGTMTESLNTMLPGFQSTIDKVIAIPGVKEVLQPIIDSVMSKVKTLTV